MSEAERLADKLEQLFQTYHDVCEHGRDGSDIMDKLAHFLPEHRATILAALRAEPSEQEVERASAEILLGIREIITRGRNDDLEQACRDVARAALRAARSRP
jgi:hypothetical protein